MSGAAWRELAPFYDLVKKNRNYKIEANEVRQLLNCLCPGVKSLLEVACGTGTLLSELHEFDRYGMDASADMLKVASEKLRGTGASLHVASLDGFSLDCQVDSILCMDGAIGYVSPELLEPLAYCLSLHLRAGGIIVVEPWYEPEQWHSNSVRVSHQSSSSVTVVRMSRGLEDGSIEFHTAVGDENGIRHFDEFYRFYLHPHDSIVSALRNVGFEEVKHVASDVFRRGLIVAY